MTWPWTEMASAFENYFLILNLKKSFCPNGVKGLSVSTFFNKMTSSKVKYEKLRKICFFCCKIFTSKSLFRRWLPQKYDIIQHLVNLNKKLHVFPAILALLEIFGSSLAILKKTTISGHPIHCGLILKKCAWPKLYVYINVI